ncbi:MAG: hypothetical protein FJ291_27720 [Planctomycetes bacterium]|nr:hypothetical protein [Planctomycetota bacterium]
MAAVANLGVVVVFPACAHLVRGDLPWSAGFVARLGASACGLGAVAALLWWGLRRLEGALAAMAEEQGQYLDSLRGRRADLAIVASAGVSLFLELAVIRWQTSLVPVFTFYKNFSLLACFAGLGLGYAISHRRHVPLLAAVPLLGWHVLVLTVVRFGLPSWHTARFIRTPPVLEELGVALLHARNIGALTPTYFLLAASFLLTALAFVPVGQLCGRVMALRPKLYGYGLNLLGSLAGVLVVFATSWLWTPPPVWFLVGFLALLAFQTFRRDALFAGVASALGALTVLVWPTGAEVARIYSPYQAIEHSTSQEGLAEVWTMGIYSQRVLNLAADAQGASDLRPRAAVEFYEAPYIIHGPAERVAIVGAGLGNDAAAALRRGCRQVDAIEIDPVILRLGAACHPEHPYTDPRVRPIVNDARTFLKMTDQRYDVIAYGLLDTKALLSHASSSVRLDSFVYTVEAFREARARLKEGGTLALAFCVPSPELGRKIYLMMQESFDGRPPLCLETALHRDHVVFLQREGRQLEAPAELLKGGTFKDVTARYADSALKVDLSTDDWPFFYMPRRVYPVSYLPVAALVLALTLLLTSLLLRGESVEPSAPGTGLVPFFLLGAGFMLVETKAITELGLAFGNTWHVIGIAIIGILLMAFLANAVVAFAGFRRVWPAYLLLLASLALGYALVRRGGFAPTASGRLAAAAVLTCPMFFSGIVFSTLLRSGGSIARIMAANLLGAMLGGFLEYNAMYFGFGFLYLLAMGLYALAFVSGLWRRER